MYNLLNNSKSHSEVLWICLNKCTSGGWNVVFQLCDFKNTFYSASVGLTTIHGGVLRIFDDVEQSVVKDQRLKHWGQYGFMNFKGSHALISGHTMKMLVLMRWLVRKPTYPLFRWIGKENYSPEYWMILSFCKLTEWPLISSRNKKCFSRLVLNSW